MRLPDVRAALLCGELAAAGAAVPELWHRLGVLRTARLLCRLCLWKALAEPFRGLGPPADERERLSRRQCADLVLLDRALREVIDPATALQVCSAVTRAGAMAFLERMIPPLAGGEMAALAAGIARLFFNVEGEAHPSGASSFVFEVRRCRFVELLAAVGAPHLAPLLCEVDEVFFASGRRPIRLTRTQTLARGGHYCDFHFQWIGRNP
jgi:hypothetical protein